MSTLLQDIRYAARLLARQPGFTLVAVLTLALGIGATTAIFSLINAVLLRPLPGIQNPEQLVTLQRLQNDNRFLSFGYPDYLDYRDQSQSFSGLAAHSGTPLSFNQGITERIRGDLVTGNYFSLLGVKAARGRLILPDDDRAGAPPVVVLSYAFWQRAFGSDESVMGQTVPLNGHSFTVVGVADQDFGGTWTGQPFDLWLPLAWQPQAIPRMSPGTLQSRASGWIGIFGRLKTGVPLEQARAELQAIARQLAQSYPDTNEHRGVDLFAGLGLDPDDRASLGKFLGLLLAAVALLLLIACSNVANLLLVRALTRRREIAVRLALGAGRVRLIRQLVTEGALLSLLAGIVGLVLAPWTASLLLAFQQPVFTLRELDLTPDARVLTFTLLVSVLTGILFALAPAWQASKTDLVTSLKEGAPAASRRTGLQSSLVVSQVALSLVLLIGAGLVVRTMRAVLTLDRGFETRNLLLLSLDLSIQGYSEPQGVAFFEQLQARLEKLPGVHSVSLAKTVPPNDWSDRISIFQEGQAIPPQEFRQGHEFEIGLRIDANHIAPRYFATLGIPLIRGRDFTPQDRANTPWVAIVSEKLAQRLWPGQDAIGKRIVWPPWEGPPRVLEVVGVARDTRYRSLLAEPPLLLYFPVLQYYDGRATLVLRTVTEAASFLPAIRAEVAALDKNLPVFAVKTMTEQMGSSLWQQRMAAGLIGSFGALALLLTAIGLAGVLADSVAQRTHEIGIRMALGARPADVLTLILGQGLRLALLGVAAGLAAAFVLTRFLSTLLFGVSATDPLTFASVTLLLAAVALLACYLPARRASRVEPLVALRYE